MRLCLVAFILPFMWVYHPELMLQDLSPSMWSAILGGFAALLTATLALAAMQVGYFKGKLGAAERLLLGIAAALIFWPGALTTAVGCILALAILERRLLQRMSRRA
jgi:TRAP-type uncharacterized transport system fused permease subunit